MRIVLQAADSHGCGHYRINLPARWAAANGVQVSTDGTGLKYGTDTRTGEIRSIRTDADLVVLQRPTTPVQLKVIRAIRECGIPVVVEVDDDLDALDPDHAVRYDRQARDIFRTALREADAVTVSTPALAARYRPDAHVIPNAVDPAWLAVDAPTDRAVGWTGSLGVHPHDLDVTRGTIGRAAAENGATVRVIGSEQTDHLAAALGRCDEAIPWLPLDDYPREVARFAVGLVPLAPGRFNDAKSWLKGLEYAALGVPFVASPTAEYRRLAALGLGILARRPADWHREVGRLLGDEDRRQEIAAHGRQAVRTRHTIDTTGPLWLEAWTSALARRRAA